MSWADLTLYQKIVYCVCIKVYNGLSKYMSDLWKRKTVCRVIKTFLIDQCRVIKTFLTDQSFYSVNEFMDYYCESNLEAKLWNKICAHYWDCDQ